MLVVSNGLRSVTVSPGQVLGAAPRGVRRPGRPGAAAPEHWGWHLGTGGGRSFGLSVETLRSSVSVTLAAMRPCSQSWSSQLCTRPRPRGWGLSRSREVVGARDRARVMATTPDAWRSSSVLTPTACAFRVLGTMRSAELRDNCGVRMCGIQALEASGNEGPGQHLVRPLGFEPRTCGLRVRFRSSTTCDPVCGPVVPSPSWSTRCHRIYGVRRS
jgi:hypothetical protein